MPTVNNATDKRYKLVPPDGGWGYVVALGQIVIFVSLFGAVYGFALIFNDFLLEIGIGTSIVAILTSCSSAALSIAGLFSDILGQKFSRRSVGVTAAIIYCFGSLFEVFAYSAWPLFVAAIIHGAALGIILPIVFSTFNQYFVERRTFITSATSIVTGFGQVGAPLTVQYLMEEFGFRGCLAILAAIHCHSILGMWVMQPVEWHMKRIPVDQEFTGEVLEELNDGEAENDQQLRPLIVNSNNESELLTDAKDRPSTIGSKNNSTRSSRANSRRSSMVHALDWAGSVVISEAVDREPKPETTDKTSFIGKMIDLGLLKDAHYVILIFGIVITLYSDHSFAAFQPLHLFELGYSKVEVSRIIASGTAGELVSTCVLTAITACKPIPPKLLYSVAVVIMIICRYVFFYINLLWGMVSITAIIGFFKIWIYVPVGLLFAEYLPEERFTSGYGLFLFLNGIFNLAFGPIIRIVKESSKSYLTVYHVLNILLILNAIVWSLEYLWICLKRRKNQEASVQNARAQND